MGSDSGEEYGESEQDDDDHANDAPVSKQHKAMSSGTSTLRQFRGRGLAKLMKSVQLRRAAAKGVTAAYTCNDYSNAPMLAINNWLGYKVIGGARSLLKQV